jgi:selenocysteine lyase/cysteine desulfurase
VLSLADSARRFTQATMSYVSVIGVTKAMDQLLAAGLDSVEHHARQLENLLLDGVERHGWQPFHLRGSSAAAPHIVSLTRPGEPADRVVSRLRDQGIICSSRGGRVRVSLAPYNDEHDVADLVAALA